jgi:hypothetical protein
MVEVQGSAVAEGFKHLETIASLHFHRSPEEQLEAIGLVLESYGLGEEAREQLLKTVMEFVPIERWQAVGWVVMGYMAGLATVQYASESD